MSKKLAVYLAEGFEEGEAIVPMDIAKRAGIEVTMISISDSRTVTGSHGIPVTADKVMSETDDREYDMLMLPGGMPGTANLEGNSAVGEALKRAKADGRYIAAICAAPRYLGDLGLLDGEKATVYPGNEGHLKGASYDPAAKSVISGKVVTARGMGCAVEFGRDIVTCLVGVDKAAEILASIQYN